MIRTVTTSLIWVALLWAGTAYGQLQGTSYAQAKASGQGTLVFTYATTPGFADKAGGEIEGICVDLLDAFIDYVKRTEGITLTREYGGANPDDFGLFLEEVKNGGPGAIGLGNITITEARKETYRFSPPFINNVTIIISHKDVPELRDITRIKTQFAGMTGYSIQGSTNLASLQRVKQKHWPEMPIRELENSPEVLERVVNDKTAFANLDFTYYLAAIKNGQPIRRHSAGDEASEEFGFLMPKGSDWGPLWDRFMTEDYKASLEYKQIINEHLGASAMRLLRSLN